METSLVKFPIVYRRSRLYVLGQAMLISTHAGDHRGVRLLNQTSPFSLIHGARPLLELLTSVRGAC